jgi:hypothetical protein
MEINEAFGLAETGAAGILDEDLEALKQRIIESIPNQVGISHRVAVEKAMEAFIAGSVWGANKARDQYMAQSPTVPVQMDLQTMASFLEFLTGTGE